MSDGTERDEMSMPNRMPISRTGEMVAVAAGTSANQAPDNMPYPIKPTITPPVPTVGVQRANMTTDALNPTQPKTCHTPKASASAPKTSRPAIDPESEMVTL